MQNEQKLDIVVVDDDEGHLELVRRNFKRAGITNKLISLTSGRAALDYVFREGPYADRAPNAHILVLLDINMPGELDGVEVLRRIKASPEKRRIPIVMLTTTDDPREVDRCYELGCNVYMTKPVDPSAFIESVNRLGLFIAVVTVPGEEGASP